MLTLVVAHVWLHRNDREAQGFFVYFIGLASMGISVYKQLSFVVTGDAAPTYALFALLPLCIGIGLLRPMGRCTTGPSPFSSRPDPDASLPELVPGRKASARRARQRRKLRRRAAEAAAIAAAAAAKKP